MNMTLNDVYANNKPDKNEIIWEFVGLGEWKKPFPLVTINPVEFVNYQVTGTDQTYLPTNIQK